MKRTSNIIRDGYYFTATIPAVQGEYGELEIEYRPLLPEEVDAVFETRERGIKAYHAAVRDSMMKHIKAWSEWNEESQSSVPINHETLAALPQGLFWALWNKLFVAPEVEAEVKN